MGSKQIDGVRFQCYSLDHAPPHVHAFYGGSKVILELLPDGTVRIAKRSKAVTPGNTPEKIVRRIRRTAVERYAELLALWEAIHGKAF